MSVRDFKSLNGGYVPIVGAPIVHEWRPIITFECSCGNGKPLLITSTETAAVCTGCGAGYVLAALTYDRQQDPHGANIGIMKVKPRPQTIGLAQVEDKPTNGSGPN